MRLGWVVAALVGVASVVVIARPDTVGALYEQLYPSNPAQRRALNECFVRDPKFNRLDAAARQECYHHVLPSLANAAGVPHPPLRANFVDLWRAAGQGHLPKNDIRAEQQIPR